MPRYNTESVSHDVLAAMKQKMVEGNSSSSHSFLLDDDSTLPFAAAEVLGAMDDKDLYTSELQQLPYEIHLQGHSWCWRSSIKPECGGLLHIVQGNSGWFGG